jgi:hypothetical protein
MKAQFMNTQSMNTLITSIDQVTPQWLTTRLRVNGHLDQGEVKEIRVEFSTPSFATGTIARFHATYTPDAPALPGTFFLKIAEPDTSIGELRFYNDIVGHMDTQTDNPSKDKTQTVCCFDAYYDPDSRRIHILIEDVSHSHYHGRGKNGHALRPESELLVDCLARFHAFWWDHPLLGDGVGAFPAEDNVLFTHGFASYQKSLARLARRAGEDLSESDRDLCDKALEAFPHFKDRRGNKRLTPGNHLTLIHGDTLYDNIYLPIDPQKDRVLLIDWQTWEIRLGTDDLANLALFGMANPAADIMDTMLRRYHNGLLTHGVSGYSWEDCCHDWRLSTVRNLAIPINTGNLQVLKRAIQNFHALDCSQLLEN